MGDPSKQDLKVTISYTTSSHMFQIRKSHKNLSKSSEYMLLIHSVGKFNIVVFIFVFFSQ